MERHRCLGVDLKGQRALDCRWPAGSGLEVPLYQYQDIRLVEVACVKSVPLSFRTNGTVLDYASLYRTVG